MKNKKFSAILLATALTVSALATTAFADTTLKTNDKINAKANSGTKIETRADGEKKTINAEEFKSIEDLLAKQENKENKDRIISATIGVYDDTNAEIESEGEKKTITADEYKTLLTQLDKKGVEGNIGIYTSGDSK